MRWERSNLLYIFLDYTCSKMRPRHKSITCLLLIKHYPSLMWAQGVRILMKPYFLLKRAWVTWFLLFFSGTSKLLLISLRSCSRKTNNIKLSYYVFFIKNINLAEINPSIRSISKSLNERRVVIIRWNSELYTFIHGYYQVFNCLLKEAKEEKYLNIFVIDQKSIKIILGRWMDLLLSNIIAYVNISKALTNSSY